MLIWVADYDDTAYFSTLEGAQRWIEQECNLTGEWRLDYEHEYTYFIPGRGDVAWVSTQQLSTEDETDVFRRLAFDIIAEDPMALDAAKDILKA